MLIRKYESSDCNEVAELFYNTVHIVNAKDYTKEQLDVWAKSPIDLEKWNQSFQGHCSLVAIINGIIVGFGDITYTGYLDRLFVHNECQGRGIASAICNELERAVDVDRITTHASITARPFFEKRGYCVIQEQQVVRNGVYLTNYLMENVKRHFHDIKMCKCH